MHTHTATTFRPLPLFGNLASIPYNALTFGCILGWYQLNARGMELWRRRDNDVWNEVFGAAMLGPYYYSMFLHSERRLILHHRVVGGCVGVAVLYGLVWA